MKRINMLPIVGAGLKECFGIQLFHKGICRVVFIRNNLAARLRLVNYIKIALNEKWLWSPLSEQWQAPLFNN